MTNRRLYPRDATDEQITVMVLAQLLNVSDEEAARIFAEEDADTPIDELIKRKPRR